MRNFGWGALLLLALFSAAPCAAQFGKQDEVPAGSNGPTLEKPVTSRWKLGTVITAQSSCFGLVATLPIPTDWPEQQVRVAEEHYSPYATSVDFRMVGNVKQMVVTIPELPAGETAEVIVVMEITRQAVVAPTDTSALILPAKAKLPRDIKTYLAASPLIESNANPIKKLAKELLKDKKEEPAWEKVELLYDHVRETVQYTEGPIKGALKALNDKTGDCEELTSLFIALCRASDIPARTVWVPGHCYPEFYLQDAEGIGYWFPCQAAGTRSFGGIPEGRPILQKGDKFKHPDDKKHPVRYLAEKLTGKGGKPSVKWIREVVNTPGKK